MTDAPSHDILAVTVGPDDPADDVPVETLRSGLRSEDESVRLHAANVASFVPREDVETVKAVRDELFDLLTDDLGVVVYQATIALSLIAEDEPALLEPAVSRLVELLDGTHRSAATISATALGHVAVSHPEFLVDEVEELLATTARQPGAVFDDEAVEEQKRKHPKRKQLRYVNREERSRRQHARLVTANLLVEVAEYDPALLVPYADDLASLLRVDDVAVATAIADVVATVAPEDRAAFASAVDPLVDRLDHPDDVFVATAVTALGFVGDPAAVDGLRALADDDGRAGDLRDLAAETATFIEEANAQ